VSDTDSRGACGEGENKGTTGGRGSSEGEG